jgi:hypothetical protein
VVPNGRLLHQLLHEKRALAIDGVPVFDSGDRFLPGKIASSPPCLLLATPRGDPRLREYLAAYRDIADLPWGRTTTAGGSITHLGAPRRSRPG